MSEENNPISLKISSNDDSLKASKEATVNKKKKNKNKNQKANQPSSELHIEQTSRSDKNNKDIEAGFLEIKKLIK